MPHTEVHIAGATREGGVRHCDPQGAVRMCGCATGFTFWIWVHGRSESRWTDQEASQVQVWASAQAPISCSSGTETRMAPCPRYRDINSPFKMYSGSSCTNISFRKKGFFLHFCGGVQLSPPLLSHYWPTVPAPDGDEWSSRWNAWQGKPKYSEKTCPTIPLCPPQIPHYLTRDRNRAAAEGSLGPA
jgi:hypothetical protein